MKQKSLKERLARGEIVLGSWCVIPSPAAVEIIGYSGFDFVIIDSEHGPVAEEKAQDLVRAAEAAGIASIYRVAGNDPSLILRALDIGSGGIQVPHVSTEKEAREVVEAAKYYPGGKRGLSPFTRAARYGLDAQGYTGRANDRTSVVLNIEGVEGLKNLRKIVNVPDIDAVFIGPYDLSQSLGKPGQVEDREVISAIRQSVKISRARGVACGSFARDMRYADILLDCGIRYLTYMVDSAVLLNGYKTAGESVRKMIARAGIK
ncbi:MAG: aldolase/citrate lyase family protein [Candidatus Omnitrophota bacterium]